VDTHIALGLIRLSLRLKIDPALGPIWRWLEQRQQFLVEIYQGGILLEQSLINLGQAIENGRLAAICSRSRTEVRTTKTLMWIVRSLWRMLAAIMAPCSVKAQGRNRGSVCFWELVTICDRFCVISVIPVACEREAAFAISTVSPP
jgi:hypothetical protein